MTLVYIGDNVLDLFPDTKIAVTVKRIDVFKLSSRYVTRTNEITLPLTASNLSTLGIQDFKTASNTIYSQLNCKVVQDGYELISYGKAICTKVEKGIRLQIYDSDIDYFAAVKNLTVFDLVTQNGYEYGAARFDATGVDTLRAATTDVVGAVMDFGVGFDADFHLPIYYYQNVIKSLGVLLNVQASDISGNDLFNADIENLAFITATEMLKYNEDFRSLHNIVAQNSGASNYAGAGTNYLSFASVVSNGTISIHNGANIAFPSPVASLDYLNINGSVTITSSVSAGTAVAGDFYEVTLVRDRAGVYTDIGDTYVITIVSTGVAQSDTYTVSGNIEVRGGDLLKLRVVKGAGTPTVSIASGAATCTVISNLNVLSGYVWFDYLIQSDLMAEMFLKDWITRFGVVFKLLPDGMLTVKKLNEILNDTANSVDWTEKRDRDESINFAVNYALENYFNYLDSGDTTKRGSGSISIESALTNGESEIFKSGFSTCQTRGVVGVNATYVDVYTSASVNYEDTINELPITLLTIRDRASYEPGVEYIVSTSRLDYKVAYFEDSAFTVSTSFQYFVNTYYPIFSDSLNNFKSVKRFYNLSAKDVYEYDPHIIIFDDGEYYLINSIDNFVEGQLTKVELFRI
jgi:hypothetical protein